MKVRDLQHDGTIAINVHVRDDPTASVRKGEEARLALPVNEDDITIAIGERAFAATPSDDGSRRRLATLRQGQMPRICWIANTRSEDNRIDLLMQVNTYGTKLEWQEHVTFAVDERIIDRINTLKRRDHTADEACKWLRDQTLLPSPIDGRSRLIVTGAPEERVRFRVLGSGIEVDVVLLNERLRVESLVARSNRRRESRPEFLVEASVEYADATIAGSMRSDIISQIDRILDDEGSYLALWKTYQGIEQGILQRRMSEVGSIEYEASEVLPNGDWRFLVKNGAALAEFAERARASEDAKLQAGPALPAELLGSNDTTVDGNLFGRERAVVGEVVKVDSQRGELVLRPIDRDGDLMPPQYHGFLFPAIEGDRTQLKRQRDAMQRIRSADARMPQLALIIEGSGGFTRRTTRNPPFTAATRAAFGGTPTPEQKTAVDLAVNTPDIVVIQGPPGTGKTKVIAAVQARLAELAEERRGISGRTLLTSFQHGAVDHAVSKSSVLGLPPVRFGGPSGRSSEDEYIERWALQARDHVDSQAAQLPEERPLAVYRRVRDVLAAYTAGGLAEIELRGVIEDLLKLPPEYMPHDVWERVRMLTRQLNQSGPPPSIEHELLRRLARSLRTSPPAFRDDGPRRARLLLHEAGSLLNDPERALLNEAASAGVLIEFPRLNQLQDLQNSLLDRLDRTIVPRMGPKPNVAVQEALTEAVAALYEHMCRSLGGVADALQEYAEALHTDPYGVRSLLEHYSAVYAATCQQAVGRPLAQAKVREGTELEFENVIVDEAARATPLNLMIPMSLARRRIILVGDHRQLPHLLDPDVEAALDEPIREREKQALKNSLFERLYGNLSLLSRRDGIVRVVTLRDQYRMHPMLGKFVSDVFYEPHGEAFRSPRPASEFAHTVDGYLTNGQPRCATWQHVPFKHGAEHSGRSKARSAEARWIAAEVRRLLVDHGVDLSIGVISFYRAQVDEILAAFESEGLADHDPEDGFSIAPKWRTIERADATRDERLRVGTVDEFQGKEFDIVFLSVTRSNTLPAKTEPERRRKYGHLMLANRLCVAMSRQRLLLVGVGDTAMFDHEDGREAVPGLAIFLQHCREQHAVVA